MILYQVLRRIGEVIIEKLEAIRVRGVVPLPPDRQPSSFPVGNLLNLSSLKSCFTDRHNFTNLLHVAHHGTVFPRGNCRHLIATSLLASISRYDTSKPKRSEIMHTHPSFPFCALNPPLGSVAVALNFFFLTETFDWLGRSRKKARP
jgi:hypothetical protein